MNLVAQEQLRFSEFHQMDIICFIAVLDPASFFGSIQFQAPITVNGFQER